MHKPGQLAASAGMSLVILAMAASAPAIGDDRASARQIVRQAMAEAVAIPAQAEALVRIAWLDDHGNHEAAALAREELVNFGQHSLEALKEAVTMVDPRFTADVVSVLIDARRQVKSGSPGEYTSTLQHSLWHGSADAQRLAIRELKRYRYRPALLPIIDSCFEHPELTDLVLETLGDLGDERARFFLGQHLTEGSQSHRVLAAESLARIGYQALEILREATFSKDVETRHAAIVALVPRAGLNELTILHEYVLMHPDDDPAILEKVRDRALMLESMMDESQEFDDFSPVPE